MYDTNNGQSYRASFRVCQRKKELPFRRNGAKPNSSYIRNLYLGLPLIIEAVNIISYTSNKFSELVT